MNFESVYKKDGKLYFFDNDISSICYTQDYFRTRVVQDELPRSLKNSFCGLSIFGKDNSIFVNDMGSRRIIEYSLIHRSYHVYSYDFSDDYGDIVVCDSILCGSKVVQLPVDLSKRITVFDSEEKSFITKGLLTGNNILGGKRGYYSKDKNLIATPIYGENVVIIYDVSNETTQFYDFPKGISLYSTCIHDGVVYGVSDNALYIANGRSVKKVEIDDVIENEAFSRVVYYKGRVILLSRHSKSNYVYDVRNNVITKAQLDKAFILEEQEATSYFLGYFFEDEKMYLLPWKLNFVMVFDMNSLEMSKIETTSIFNLSEKAFFYEYEENNLKDFITSCCAME